MANFVPRSLKEQAAHQLDRQGVEPRKMVLIHTGVTVLLTLLSNCLTLLLDHWIGGTGGLRGLGARSVLQTVQSLFQIGVMLFTPFWSAGLVRIALRWADGQDARNSDLTSGFRRASAIVGYEVCMILMLFCAVMFCSYAAVYAYTILPLTQLLPQIFANRMIVTIGYVAVLAVIMAVLGFVVRLSNYFIMDQCEMGGFASVRASFRAMKGNWLALLKLDLSYWWYYLLEAGLVLVCYLGVIVSLAGFKLPMDGAVLSLLLVGVYCVLELWLHVTVKPKMETVYALAYRAATAPKEPYRENMM